MLSLYLTPEGDTPSDEMYIPTSYTTICEIVEHLTEKRQSTLGADVRTLMTHYTQMLRRHILTESPIAQLCRDIYKKHKNALDLIYEHRPDQQAAVRELLEGLIRETPSLSLDHCTKSYVRFAPQSWDVQTLKTGEGWTPFGRILLFEIENYAERLKLRLTIGPGPEAVRQGLFNMAQTHQPPFRLSSKSLYKKWNTIYDKAFLSPRDYEDKDDVELADEIRIHWTKFLKNDLPLIMEVIREQEWIK